MTQARASTACPLLFSRRVALAPFMVLALVLALLTISGCSAEQNQPEAEPYPPPNPLLYELANADGEVEGWLFGTIHALPDGVSWRNSNIEQVIGKADLLMVEVAQLGSSQAIAETFARLSITPGLAPIDQRVSPAFQPQLEQMLEASDYSRSSFDDVEDWASAIMLARVGAPGDPDNGVDKALIEEFGGRDVRGFETAGSQLGIFDTLAPEDQRALLEGTIQEWEASKDNPGKLLRAWIKGDAETLEKATSEGIMADREIRDALLVDRNEDWIAQLVPVLETDQKPLVAVGAAHLVGPDSLSAMLKPYGYTARRIGSP